VNKFAEATIQNVLVDNRRIMTRLLHSPADYVYTRSEGSGRG